MPLTNQNPSIRWLVPELMGGLKNPKDQTRPETETLRHAYVDDGALTTYGLPGDFPESPDAWFATEASSFSMRTQSSVEYYIDGQDTYAAMLEAIETATSPEHFIILVGWAAHLDFKMSWYGSRTAFTNWTAEEVFRVKVEQGVRLRVLVWDNTSMHQDVDLGGHSYTFKTKWFVDRLNDIEPYATPRRAICIVDDNTRVLGAHHQKILIVYGSEGLVAFFGGVDINSDRVLYEKLPVLIGPGFLDPHGPLHDVHARVTGDAAEDLLQLVVDRWNTSHPVHGYSTLRNEVERALYPRSEIEVLKPVDVDPALPKGASESSLPERGKILEDLGDSLRRAQAGKQAPREPYHVVQIAQTVGNPDLVKAEHKSDAWPLIKHAIKNAKKFIYIEDQYFFNTDIAEELAAALPNVRHLTIVLPPDDAIGYGARHQALKVLYDKAGDEIYKVGVYVRKGPVHQYIHAKMFVFDDELAIIGSANSNNRGYFYDSEVVGAIADPAWDVVDGPRAGEWFKLELNLAHKLRMKLWSEHLGVSTDRLLDGVASATYWENPPRTAEIQPYTAALHSVFGTPWKDAAKNNSFALELRHYVDHLLIDPKE